MPDNQLLVTDYSTLQPYNPKGKPRAEMQVKWVNKSRNGDSKFFLISNDDKMSYGCMTYNKLTKSWVFTSPLFVAFGGQFMIDTETDSIWNAETIIICEVQEYLTTILAPFDKSPEEYRHDREIRIRPSVDRQQPVFRSEEVGALQD